MRAAALAVLLVSCACAASLHAAEGGRLGRAQIEQLIVGNTMRGPIRAGARMVEYAYYHEAAGRLRGSLGVDSGDKGTWRIDDEGVHCMKFQSYFNGGERCYEWHESGGAYTLKNVDAYRTGDLPVWRIDEGNPDGF